MKKLLSALLAIIILAITFTGCSGQYKNETRADIATQYVDAVFAKDFKALNNFPVTIRLRMSLLSR